MIVVTILCAALGCDKLAQWFSSRLRLRSVRHTQLYPLPRFISLQLCPLLEKKSAQLGLLQCLIVNTTLVAYN